MSKKEKVLLFTNIITAVLLVVLGGILLFSKDKNEKVEMADEQKNIDTNNCVQETKIDGHLIYSNGNEENKIYLRENKKLELVSKDLGNKVIAENVTKTYDVNASQSDICEGNRWVIAQTEDNKFVAISIDAMACGEKVEILDVSSELSQMKLNNTMSIYTTETFINQYEPTSFKVYALSEDGKSTEITSIFE